MKAFYLDYLKLELRQPYKLTLYIKVLNEGITI